MGVEHADVDADGEHEEFGDSLRTVAGAGWSRSRVQSGKWMGMGGYQKQPKFINNILRIRFANGTNTMGKVIFWGRSNRRFQFEFFIGLVVRELRHSVCVFFNTE